MDYNITVIKRYILRVGNTDNINNAKFKYLLFMRGNFVN